MRWHRSASKRGLQTPHAATMRAASLAHYQIIRRNGGVVPFEPNKIAVAMMKAFLAVHGTQGAASASVRETVDGLTQAVIRALVRSRPGGGTFHIEDVQDQVELGLMRGGHHEIARAYVLYRERARRSAPSSRKPSDRRRPLIHVTDRGNRVALDIRNLQALIEASCAGLGADVKPDPIVAETMRNLYDGVPIDEVYKASILAARTLIEKDPDYTYATARLLMHTIFKEVLGAKSTGRHGRRYAEYFPQFIKKGVENELLDEKLLQFDLARLGAALKPERDLQFDYLGLQTLFDRYFLHVRKQPASSCRRPSSCAWPWACRSTRSTAKRAPSSSTKSCRPSTSCRARPRCSTPARCARSCRPAT
jgi:ribonucleoside-diphosphate reductase alpha chain